MNKKENIFISVSVVLYKTKPSEIIHVYQCLLQSEISFELILIDNSPDDRLKDVIKNHRVRYIFTGKNLGFGKAHNLAIKEMIRQAEFHLVINADISFSANVLTTLIRYMKEHPEVGQIMPKVLSPNGEIQYLCKLLPTPMDLVFRRFLPSGLFKKRKEEFELRFSGYNRIMEVPYLSGCFMLLRTAALREVGFFDERFFMYPEDIDLTRRINEKFRTIYFPEVHIYHHHAKESYKNNQMLFIHMINMIKYFNKWGWFYDKKRKRTNRITLENLSAEILIRTA
jgi:GT2 family glycosyltransferase